MLKFKIGTSNVKVSGITYVGGMTGTGKTTTLIELARQNADSERTSFFCSRDISRTLLPVLVDGLSRCLDSRCNVYVDNAEELKETQPELYSDIIKLSAYHNIVLGGFQTFDVRTLNPEDAYIRTSIMEMGDRWHFTRALIFPEIGRNTAEFCGSCAEHRITKG